MSDHNWGGSWGPGAPAIYGKRDKETIADLKREVAELREALEEITNKLDGVYGSKNNIERDAIDRARAALKGKHG